MRENNAPKMESTIHEDKSNQTPIEFISRARRGVKTTVIGIPESQQRLLAITSRINTINEDINANIKLLDIAEVNKSFIQLRDKISEVSVQTTSKTLMTKLKSVSILGNVIKKAEDTAFSMQSVHSTLTGLFASVEAKYDKLVLVGTNLQHSKADLEKQIKELSELETSLTEVLNSYDKDSAPLNLISVHTQTGVYLAKYHNRLLKVESSIFAARETIQQLGAYLPTFKSELNDELALAALLKQVSDYQIMFQNLSSLVKEIGDITEAKTQETILDLIDIQIKDTSVKDIIIGLQTKANSFSNEVIAKADKLHNKLLEDHKLYKEVANKGLLAPLDKIKKLTGN